MKSFLIIPMGGIGKRFLKKNYKTYKSFLPISTKDNIFQNIKKNFDNNTHIIILGSSAKVEKYFVNKKDCTFIKIAKHKKGPLYSIFLALEKLRLIIGKKENVFISYTDINWKWKKKDVAEILQTKVCVLTHSGFHPHLEVNKKSDFCILNKKHVLKISEKKTNYKDYKIDNLAIGCYFFKNLNYVNLFFSKFNFKKYNQQKEFYVLTLINFLIKKRIKISNHSISKFVHLGTPEQYEDYMYWNKKFNEGFKKLTFQKNNSIMLMCGKGERVKNLKEKKPFLKVEKKEFYKLIFEKFNTKSNKIITTKKYYSQLDKKNYEVSKISQTDSMLDTISDSKKLLLANPNFFLLSCDCFGDINERVFNKLLKLKNLDLIIFSFKKTYLNSSLKNSHTSIKIKKNKINEIFVKKDVPNSYGHAGFFWINSSKVFRYLDLFYLSKNFKRISSNREVIIDDYFKFLLKKNLTYVKHILLNDYLHLGSSKEFNEYNYWKNYFN